MKTKNSEPGRRYLQAIAAVFLLLVIISITPAAAEPLTEFRHINVQVANDAGARFDTFGNNTYYVKCDGGGLNAMHITNDATVRNGQVTTSDEQSGTFYLTNTGGRGYNDEVILLLAVNGTIPDDFAVHIKSSGYRWEPNSMDNKEYVPIAVDETFRKEDFIYGPQIWRPSTVENYPFFYEQNMSDTENTFQFMFIDLGLGQFYGDENTTWLGATRVDYSFENLETFAAFDNYGYCKASNQDEGISWTNRVTGSGSSCYNVIGVPAPTEPTLTTIAVTPDTAALLVNENQTFTATAFDQDGIEMSEITIAWSSSDETVGIVDEDGYFEALSSGTTTITAASGDVEGTAEVTVTALPAELTTIEVSAAPGQALYPGEGHQFTATGFDQEGNEMPEVAFVWSSDNETVGMVNETGWFEGLAAGTTTVTAENGAVNGTVAVSVETAPDWSFTLTGAESMNLNRSGFANLAEEHYAECADFSSNIWSGVDLWTLVALVDDSDPTTLNTALAEKDYTIIVTGQRRSRPFTLDVPSSDLLGEKDLVVANMMNGAEIRPGTFGREVYWPLKLLGGSREISALTSIELSLPAPSEIIVTPSEAVLKVGETTRFSAETFDQYGNAIPDTPFTWATDDETLGTIDEDGLFTAVAGGTLNVTAAYADAIGTASVRVVPADHEPATICVDASGSGDYTTIQEAVDAAYDWDTVLVRNGTYNETVTVGKCITIRSENGPETTILHAPVPTAKALDITTKDVTISGLTITGGSQSYSGLAVLVKDVENVTFYQNIVRDNWNALFFDGCTNCLVYENTFERNAFAVHCEQTSGTIITGNEGADNNYGAYILKGCTDNTVTLNTFTGGATGINIGAGCTGNVISENTLSHISSTGIRVDGTDNTFSDNTVDYVPFYGMYIQNAHDNVFTGNVINATSRAVGLITSYDNEFTENVFSNTSYVAIYVGGAAAKENVFYLNNFVDVDTLTTGDVKQIWQSPDELQYAYEGNIYCSRLGNYWDNYTGVDKLGDGIGDESYPIDTVNEQCSPLMKPHDAYVASQPEEGTTTGKVALNVPGCTFPTGGNRVAINMSLVDSSISEDGTEINLYRGAYTLVFRMNGTATLENGQITGNYTGISLIPRQLVLEGGEAGPVGGSMVINLTTVPENAILNTILSIHSSPTTESLFDAALSSQGLKAHDIAFMFHVQKAGLEDGAEIADATIFMNVSEDWVNALGGPEHVRILRLGDDGRCSVLDTVFIGFSDQYGYMFRADSPEGLCDFGLVGVTKVVAPSGSSSGSGGATSSIATARTDGINAGEVGVFVMDQTAVTEVDVKAGMNIPKMMVTAEKVSAPSKIDAAPNEVYQYIEIASYLAPEGGMEMATLKFSVDKDWLKSLGAAPADVKMYHYDEESGAWVVLSTVPDGETESAYLFFADTPSFSLFAISAEKSAASVAPEPSTDVPQPTAVSTDTPKTAQTTSTDAQTPVQTNADNSPFVIIVVIAIIAACGGAYWWNKSGKK